MIMEVAKWVIIMFGGFILLAGSVMLIAPEKARQIVRKAGSTNLINYAEVTIRLIPALALIIYADHSKFPAVSEILGWFMLLTSLILYAVPRKLHHQFSVRSAELLRPVYLQLISVFAFVLGGLIIYSAL
jgi:hypothetical protein